MEWKGHDLWRGALYCGFIMRGRECWIVSPVGEIAYPVASEEQAKAELERCARDA